MFTAKKLHETRHKSNVANGGSWLFKLQRESDGAQFHLLGTDHSLSSSVLPPTLRKKILGCHVLLMEAGTDNDIDNQPETVIRKFPCQIESPEDAHAGSFLSLSSYMRNFIRKEFAVTDAGQLCLANNINNFKLWFIYAVLFDAVMRKTAAKGMDLELHSEFQRADKTVAGLESLCERIEVYGLPTLDKETCIERIQSLIDEKPESLQDAAVLSEYHERYLAGDITECLQERIEDEEDDDIVYKRNRTWVPNALRLLQNYKDQSVVAAVGRGHLLGQNGLLKLFADKGFTVKRYVDSELIPFSIDDMLHKENEIRNKYSTTARHGV